MRLDFGHALRDFLSKNQEAREYAANTLLKESGESGAVSGVIAHHPQLGFRASVMAAFASHPNYAEEAARYLGAWHGVLTQDPDLVAFTIREGGTDRLHHLSAPVPPQELAKHLRDAGILRFALRPGETTSTAHVYDQGGVYDLAPLAEKLGGNVNYSVGSGRRLGEGAGAHAGANYRDHIKRAESAAAAPSDAETDRLRLARLGNREFAPWRDSVHAAPDDRVRRGAFADWLEERGYHEDDDTLHTLRTHDGPVSLIRTGVTGRGKVRAVAGHPDDVTAAQRALLMYPQTRAGLHTVRRLIEVPGADGPRNRFYVGWKRATGDHRSTTAVSHPSGLFTSSVYDDYDPYSREVVTHPDTTTARQHILSHPRR